MGKRSPADKKDVSTAKVHLKKGHAQGTKFKTPWEQLAAKLKTRASSPQDLQRSFEVLQEFRPEDVAKLSAAGKKREGGGGSALDCRKGFFVQGRKSVSWQGYSRFIRSYFFRLWAVPLALCFWFETHATRLRLRSTSCSSCLLIIFSLVRFCESMLGLCSVLKSSRVPWQHWHL